MTQKPTESVSQARETSSTSRGIDQNRSTTSSHSKEAGGLGNNGAAALAYGFGFFTGLVMYLITDDEFVRFHSVQSMLVFATLLPLSIGLSIVQFFLRLFPVIGGILATTLSIFSTLLGPVTGILWLVLIYKAYQGERYHLPVVGDVAERFA